jgi:hypothetical protein
MLAHIGYLESRDFHTCQRGFLHSLPKGTRHCKMQILKSCLSHGGRYVRVH